MPFAAGSSSSALINGQVYVAGGIIGSATTSQAARYDPATNTWTTLAAMPQGATTPPRPPTARSSTSSAAAGGQRRRQHRVADGFDTVQVYDPATNTWASSTRRGFDPGPAAAEARRDGQGRVSRRRVLRPRRRDHERGGGQVEGNVYDRVDVYNPISNAWRLDGPLPTARHGIFPLAADGEVSWLAAEPSPDTPHRICWKCSRVEAAPLSRHRSGLGYSVGS